MSNIYSVISLCCFSCTQDNTRICYYDKSICSNSKLSMLIQNLNSEVANKMFVVVHR